ncbi:MAG TPA: hypothetical protein VLX92_26165, partial [Kofleriaceae bacterium]|nr:hypothetical protein [Kofleriaceae bacterium]
PPPAPAPAHPALATPDAAVVTAPPRDVTGDGFRYPIPGSFTELRRPDGALAYTGTIAGALKPATLTVWATSEPFTGTLAQLVARETAAATEAGAPAPDVEPLDVAIGGKVKPGDARRMTIRLAERIELRALAVDHGKAYVLHCETPNTRNALQNVSADCIARASAFEIAR